MLLCFFFCFFVVVFYFVIFFPQKEVPQASDLQLRFHLWFKNLNPCIKRRVLSLLKPCRNNFADSEMLFLVSDLRDRNTVHLKSLLLFSSRAGQKSWSHAASWVVVCVCSLSRGFCWVVWAVVTSNCFEGQIFRKTDENPSWQFKSLCTAKSVNPVRRGGTLTSDSCYLQQCASTWERHRHETMWCVYICKNISSYFFALQIDNINSKLYMENIYGDWKQIHFIGYANLKC